AEMLKDAGACAVIVGHSERRAYHKETDAEVRAKALAAWRAGLVAIVCVGETQAERTAGHTIAVVGEQIAGSLPDDGAGAANWVVPYEPVWAIGSGLTPTAADVAQVHGFIRERLVTRYGAEGQGMRILYGGSVKPSNAGELLRVDNVNGALVGGASLKAADFFGIARASWRWVALSRSRSTLRITSPTIVGSLSRRPCRSACKPCRSVRKPCICA